MDKKRSNKKNGRIPINDPACHRYYFRLNSVENAQFESLYLTSGMSDKASFIKSLIFGRPIKVVKVDKAAMDYYMRLTTLHAQFQKIGVNYNQIVKKLYSNFGEKRAQQLLLQVEKATRDLIIIHKQVIQLTHEYEQKHLDK